MLERAARDALYAQHLNDVSRSFAPGIAQLHAPLRRWVALAYLLFRVLDTVEDAPWESASEQRRQFLCFDELVRRMPTAVVTAQFCAAFPTAIPAAEAQLLTDAQHLFADLHALPRPVRSSMQQGLLQMSAGMRRFAEEHAQHGALRLPDTLALNRYCYVVAGIVGVLLTRWAALVAPEFRRSRKVGRDALHFALFLQKINVLKDQRRDEAEGRFLLPDRNHALRSLQHHAAGAARYLLAIPKTAGAFRCFCAWSLLLGVQSVPLLQQATTSLTAAAPKIPRAEAEALLATINALCADDARLAKTLREAVAVLPGGQPPRPIVAGAHERRRTIAWLKRLPGQMPPAGQLDALFA